MTWASVLCVRILSRPAISSRGSPAATPSTTVFIRSALIPGLRATTRAPTAGHIYTCLAPRSATLTTRLKSLWLFVTGPELNGETMRHFLLFRRFMTTATNLP